MSQTDVGDLPEGWRMVTFGGVARNVDIHERNPLEHGIQRFVGLDHIEPQNLHIKRWGNISDGTTFTRRFEPGQVLFGKRRAYQRKAAVADFDGVCSGDILVFEPLGDELLAELLPFIVESEGFFEHALRTSAGSLSPRTKWKDLAQYTFPLPPKAEQRRIADVLWAADTAVERWRGVNAQLQSLGKDLIAQVIQGARTQGHVREAILGTLVLDIVAGRSPASASRPAQPGETGVLKVSAVGDDGFHAHENKALLRTDDFRPNLEVQPGFLLITRANAQVSGVGRVCLVEATRPGLMLSDKTLRLIPDVAQISPRLLELLLRSRDARLFIESAAGGTEAKNISQARLRHVPLQIPTGPFRGRIERLQDQLNSSFAAVKTQLEGAARMRSALRERLIGSVHV